MGSPNGIVEGPFGPRSIGQANNVFIFPGVGLGTIVNGAEEVTDETFRIAAHRLAACVTTDRLAAGALYPPIAELRSVAREVAITVAAHGLGSGVISGASDRAVREAIDRAIWWPDYQRLIPAG
jgi:malic enzyme